MLLTSGCHGFRVMRNYGFKATRYSNRKALVLVWFTSCVYTCVIYICTLKQGQAIFVRDIGKSISPSNIQLISTLSKPQMSVFGQAWCSEGHKYRFPEISHQDRKQSTILGRGVVVVSLRSPDENVVSQTSVAPK
ncbi:hypothetical protein M0802_015559 [Mischocyttarus mexicanus]|nr:hypothetical protein M0802_015559 [Mischocyttarus mexicanus]